MGSTLPSPPPSLLLRRSASGLSSELSQHPRANTALQTQLLHERAHLLSTVRVAQRLAESLDDIDPQRRGAEHPIPEGSRIPAAKLRDVDHRLSRNALG
jgi:hypothetical protein